MAIGYACIALAVPGAALTRCTLATATPGRIRAVTRHNLDALRAMIDYNRREEIRLFRISSDIVPFFSHPANPLAWWDEETERLAAIGAAVRDGGLRVSMHPGQYTVLNSPRAEVVEATRRDLAAHARFLDALGLPDRHRILLHLGGVYGDRRASLDRFVEAARSLPEAVLRRLTLENDERCFSIGQVLEAARRLGLPAIFDNLHHRLLPEDGTTPEAEWIRLCRATWDARTGPQKVHYSQQEPGGRPGAHAGAIAAGPFLEETRDWFRADPDLDVMLEVKDKNLSAIKCLLLQAERAAEAGGAAVSPVLPEFRKWRTRRLEAEWGRWKYPVLARSQPMYREIREALKDKGDVRVLDFYRQVESALTGEGSAGDRWNAAQHVFGHMKHAASEADRRRLDALGRALLSAPAGTPPDDRALQTFLRRLAEVHGDRYIRESYYFADPAGRG